MPKSLIAPLQESEMSQSELIDRNEDPTKRRVLSPVKLPGHNPPGSVGDRQCRPVGILVIDDEWLMRKAIMQGLEDRGFAVWVAANGAEGVEGYRRFGDQIDVVLCDVHMPVLNGPQTIAALRNINPFVRCCFMTGDTRSSTLCDLQERGAVRIFTKPLPSVAKVAEELHELAIKANGFPILQERCADF